MKLMTKEIEQKLAQYPLYSQESKGDDADIVCKFFNPCGAGTWYVLEGNKLPNGDWEFFGIVDLLEREYGYFMLSELQSYRSPFGLGIERDLYFGDDMKVKDIK